MQDALSEFLEHLRLNENASAHTVRAYESDLSQFLAFVAAEGGRRRAALTPDDFTHLSIRAFLGDLHKRGNSRASAARKLAAHPDVRALPAARGRASTATRPRSSARRSASTGCRRTSARRR